MSAEQGAPADALPRAAELGRSPIRYERLAAAGRGEGRRRRLQHEIGPYRRYDAANDRATARPVAPRFSTLWKTLWRFFHAMENIFPQYGKPERLPPAPAGAVMNGKRPAPRHRLWNYSENKGLHRTAHKLRHLYAFATINPVAASALCMCAVR